MNYALGNSLNFYIYLHFENAKIELNLNIYQDLQCDVVNNLNLTWDWIGIYFLYF
jgi:hypothetical protein